jgi:hydrogenase maturation protease
MFLLIGYGNCLRRDDGSGPALAKMVRENAGYDDIRVIEAHQLAPELAEQVSAHDVTAVVFMDASVVQGKKEVPYMPTEVEMRKLDSAAATPSFAHYCDPCTLLLYAELLYSRKPPAWLVSIPGVDFSCGEGFSEIALHSLVVAQDMVLNLLDRLRVDHLSHLHNFHQLSA